MLVDTHAEHTEIQVGGGRAWGSVRLILFVKHRQGLRLQAPSSVANAKYAFASEATGMHLPKEEYARARYTVRGERGGGAALLGQRIRSRERGAPSPPPPPRTQLTTPS
jgi:hypothetical protein